jgi:hypothetical protein
MRVQSQILGRCPQLARAEPIVWDVSAVHDDGCNELADLVHVARARLGLALSPSDE